MTIRVKDWIAAEESTMLHRMAVQCFLYRDDDAVKNENNAGMHVIRDTRLPAGNQVVWQKIGSHEDYEAVHAEMIRAHREYCVGLIVKEYEAPKVEDA